MSWLQVFIGDDSREPQAAAAALKSLRAQGVDGTLLCDRVLRDRGLLWRPVDRRGAAYDILSNANQSTEFAASRFLAPILATQRWVLFVDGDVIFVRDPQEMLKEIEPGKAVYVVQHDYAPSTVLKMDAQVQAPYRRKGWSSVALYDTLHPAHRRLTLQDVNRRPGRDLHAFYWLADDEIGELDRSWNWLVGEQSMPDRLAIAHFTLGGPFTPGWGGGPHDDLWLKAAGA